MVLLYKINKILGFLLQWVIFKEAAIIYLYIYIISSETSVLFTHASLELLESVQKKNTGRNKKAHNSKTHPRKGRFEVLELVLSVSFKQISNDRVSANIFNMRIIS